jgi:hypothetical protein
VARPLVFAEVAVGASDGPDPGQDPRAHATRLRRTAAGGAVEGLNPALRGWGNYFRWGSSSRKFSAIDCYVNQRLAKLASVKHGLRGWNWTTRYTHGWATGLGVYRLSGTVRRWPAYARR